MSRRVSRVLASTCSSKLDGEEEGEAFPSFFTNTPIATGRLERTHQRAKAVRPKL